MSSYVQHILQPGEHIRYIAKIHWITNVPGYLCLIIAIILAIYGGIVLNGSEVFLIAAAVVAVIAGILLFRAWFERWTTEIGVTDRRVIYKTGFIRLETNEMHMDKVESVRVDQSILGRILGYGDVTVLGTGEGFETIRTIGAPLALRNQITGV